MEIKNILQKINPPAEEIKSFFAIEIGHEVVKTAIWRVNNKTTEVVSIGSIEEWKKDAVEDLVQAVDRSLTVALDGATQEPDEVIFGLPETWVSPDGIVDAKKTYLKTITQKLELKPIGFVVTTEAIVHYLRMVDGGPPSSILISLTETEAMVSLVKLGEIVGTQAVGRSEDLGKDVEEGIARFGSSDDLPSRILMYDGNIDLESAKQTLISYDWESALPFLHFPKIEDLSPQNTIKAIAIAGGAEVAKSLGIEIKEPEDEEKPQSSAKNPLPAADIVPETSPDFGFEDVTPPPNSNQSSPDGDNFTAVMAEPDPEPNTIEEKDSQKKIKFKLPNIRHIFSFMPSISRLKPFQIGKSKVPPIIPIGITTLLILIIGSFMAYWNLPKAEVSLFLKPRTIEKEVEFTLSPKQDILDADNAIIPSQEESIDLEGEKEITTTGDKTVGERASGTITIFNRTNSSKTFPEGTELSSDQYAFTLNEEVNIASASTEEAADFSTKTVPAQADGKVTASSIGDKYNFASGTELSVESFAKSSFVARAKSDFTGGFSREIQAVSQEDYDGIKTDLLSELKQQGIDNLSVVASQKKGVVELQEEQVVSETYSAEVGEEKDLLRLALKFKLPIYTYQIGDLSLLLEKKYQEDFPNDFTIQQDDLEVEIVSAILDEETGDVSVVAKIKLNLIPELDLDEISQSIRGKYPELTKDYFTNLPNFSKVETKFSITLPTKLQTFPRKAENITITVEMDK